MNWFGFTFKAILAMVLLFCFANAQENYTGFKEDTTYVADFNADSTGVTKCFNMAAFENPVFSVMCDDTSSDGYDSDSILFRWGIEYMNVVMNSSGKKDTSVYFRVLCDTFDIATAGNLTIDTKEPDSLGNFGLPLKFIDTSNVYGYAVQTYPMYYYVTPLFRFWYEGITGNKTESYVPLVFSMNKRKSVYVKTNN